MAAETGLACCVQSSGDQIVTKKPKDTRQVRFVKTVFTLLERQKEKESDE